ncbi:hypothetical protein B194_0580 [Serratia plymuthica A30]|jgi:hypothetical protein|nr:hypothetical protein B194_0580 [Serratia plymuthica A30]
MTSLAGVNADIGFLLLEIKLGIIELCGDMFDGFVGAGRAGLLA